LFPCNFDPDISAGSISQIEKNQTGNPPDIEANKITDIIFLEKWPVHDYAAQVNKKLKEE
jgi:hypothetical protein